MGCRITTIFQCHERIAKVGHADPIGARDESEFDVACGVGEPNLRRFVYPIPTQPTRRRQTCRQATVSASARCHWISSLKPVASAATLSLCQQDGLSELREAHRASPRAGSGYYANSSRSFCENGSMLIRSERTVVVGTLRQIGRASCRERVYSSV